MIKFDRILNEVKNRINAGENNFVVDSWKIQLCRNEIVASKESEGSVFLCINKGVDSPKFDIQVSGPFVNLAVESDMDSESVKGAMCTLLANVHTEMYQQYDCRYAPASLSDVDKVVRDCDIAAKLLSSEFDKLFRAKTLA